MKKYIWISLLFFIGCGSRKSTVAISKETTEKIGKTDLSQKVEYTTKQESTFDLSTFLDNQNISIAGDGNPFTLNYNGLVYSGSSAIQISNKKEQTKIREETKTLTVVNTLTRYQTHTTYKSLQYKKNKETDRKAMPWYFFIAIGFFLRILVGFALGSFKKSNIYFKIFKNTI